MSKKRYFTGEQKAIILREYWKEKQSISQIADKYKVSPQLIYKREKQVLESAPEILSAKPGRPKDFSKQQISEYINYYNSTRLHMAIYYLTPEEMLLGKKEERLAERDRKLAAALQLRLITNRAS